MEPPCAGAVCLMVWSLFADYGWFILIGLIALYVLAQNLPRKIREVRSPPPAYDPDAVAKREEAMMAARRKMQEEFNAQAEMFREKQKEREEEKRKQKIAKWESMKLGQSYKPPLGQSPAEEPDAGPSTSAAAPKPKSEKKPLRSGGFNPLSGEGGGSCTWRPGRRGPSSGG
ncbi:selenoprotein S isoform X2 [Eublepharis macularius]|uniref:Selenoprotein S isoform X2 n=1 Tax=Eublepharis macularius TaxID=481883 RepID=A0AA97KMG1_EUBMA|nr:selenoprotein S isoform X2 [Eublepharis macularius]